jgi:GLPGLI family protein
MKNIYLILLVLLPLLIYSQKHYQVNYEMTTLFDGPKKYESKLLFTSSNSVFKYRLSPKDNVEKETTDENGNIHINLPDKNIYKIFYNSKEKTLKEIKHNVFSQSIVLVQDSIVLPVWKLHKERKKINNFLCNKATTFHKGRNYTVWYTLEYPTKFGPWKLNGLPGLIVTAFDDKKEVFFEAKEIKEINEEVEKEPKIKTLSQKEYKKEKEKSFKEFESKMTSKSDRNLKISFTLKEKSIEIE